MIRIRNNFIIIIKEVIKIFIEIFIYHYFLNKSSRFCYQTHEFIIITKFDGKKVANDIRPVERWNSRRRC